MLQIHQDAMDNHGKIGRPDLCMGKSKKVGHFVSQVFI